jgi:O-antigen/teichoic acid export membrane protein
MLWFTAGNHGVRPRLTWDPAEFKRLLKEALPFFGQGLFESISSRLDLFILSHTIGEQRLGGYMAARQLAGRATIIIDGSATALLPSLARLRATNPSAATPILRGTLLWLLTLTVPFAVAVAIAAPEIMTLVFGPQFVDGTTVLVLQILALPLTASAVVTGHALFVTHRNKLVVTSSMVSTGTKMALVVPLTFAVGTRGEPIAHLASRVLLNIIRVPRALADYPGMWTRQQSVRLFGITSAVAAPFILARLAGGGIPMMIAAGLLSLTAWCAILWRFDMVPLPILSRIRRFFPARWTAS